MRELFDILEIKKLLDESLFIDHTNILNTPFNGWSEIVVVG